MTNIKAILRARTGSYDEFYAANMTYKLGEATLITSGTDAGRVKYGNGVTPWRNLKFSPDIGSGTPGVVKSSDTHFLGKINANGTFTITGIEADISAIQARDTTQDGRLSVHDTALATINQTIEGLEGAMIYIGVVSQYTNALAAMTPAARNALLTARAVYLRGQVKAGYTLQDLGVQNEPGRFNYWQYQKDGTWFDLGERGDVSQATDDTLGIVMGSTASYKIHIEIDGSMSVNDLVNKLNALDAKDTAQGQVIDLMFIHIFSADDPAAVG
jgi:hypothetical protein